MAFKPTNVFIFVLVAVCGVTKCVKLDNTQSSKILIVKWLTLSFVFCYGSLIIFTDKKN